MKRLLVLSAAVVFGLNALAELCISEICPKPSGADPNGFESGWVELYNAGDESVDLANYELVRVNRGKALKTAGKPLASRTVAAKGYTVVYTSEMYDNAKDLGGDESVKVYANDVMVYPAKVNPKKYPLVALYKKDGTLLQKLVVPVDIPDGATIATAGGAFPAYVGEAAATDAGSTDEAAAEIPVAADAFAIDAGSGIALSDGVWSFAGVTGRGKGVSVANTVTAALAAADPYSFSLKFRVSSLPELSDETGVALFSCRASDTSAGVVAYLGYEGRLQVLVGDATGATTVYSVDSELDYADGNWHTLEVVCGQTAASRIAISVDGTSFVDTKAGVAAALDAALPVRLGCSASDWPAFTGDLKDVKFYTGAIIPKVEQRLPGDAYTKIAVKSAVSSVILPTATRGTANNRAGEIPYGPNVGPLLGVKHSLSDWQAFPQATNGQPYAVSLLVNPVNAAVAGDAIASVTLIYRSDFGATNTVEMAKGAASDTAGQAWTAEIPSDKVPKAGSLLRWAAVITDTAGNTWRSPSFRNPDDGYEWYGTLVSAPTLESKTLQTLHLFADSTAKTNMDKQYDSISGSLPLGARVGLFDSSTGYYYDNVRIDLRGNTTAGFSKKSHGLRFNKSQPLSCVDPVTKTEVKEIRKTSFVAEYSDPAIVRQSLSMKVMRDMGMKVPFDYPVRLNLNGDFYQLAWNSNRFTDELIEDYYKLDPYGYGYKSVGTLAGSSTANNKKKVTPDDGNEKSFTVLNTYQSAISGADKISETYTGDGMASELPAVTKAVVEKFDLPAWLNYLAVTRITQECDDVWANLCAYIDVNGTGTLMPLAYDLHLSWGAYYKDGSIGNAGTVANYDWYKSHPFYGGYRVRCHDSSTGSAINSGNRGFEAVWQSPKFRRLYLRRLRTAMDKILKAPGTTQAETPFWSYVEALKTACTTEDDLDNNKWGYGTGTRIYDWSKSMTLAEGVSDLWTNYVEKRRTHFYVTHAATNSAFAIGYARDLNAGIPLAQRKTSEIAAGFSCEAVEGGAVIRNANADVIDMSGWTLTGPVTMTLPAGTVIDGKSGSTPGEVFVVIDRKTYVAANAASLTDQVIVGNAGTSAVAVFGLKDDAGEDVVKGVEPEPLTYQGDFAEPVTIQTSGEYEFLGANFNAGLTFGSGTYVVSVKKSTVNTASNIVCPGTLIIKGKGELSLSGTGSAPLMTVGDLIVSNGTVKVAYESTVAKSSAVLVNGNVLLDNTGTIDLTVSGTQGYGISLNNKDTKVTMAAGDLKANVSGTKCAAVNLKGSCDAKLKGGTVTATLGGTNAKVVNGGSQSFSGADIDVTMPDDITGMLEARPFNADKKIKISDGNIKIDIPAYGSEAFATAEAAGTIDISGGKIEIRSGDDCVSAYTDVTVSGGLFYGTSISNDVIDANGNIAISGGTVLAYTTATEADGNGSFGLDVNEGNTITITGGSVVALGAGNAVIHGSPAGCLVKGAASSVYSGKYACVSGVTETAINTLTVKLPEITTATCSLLLYTPGVAADATPVVGDTAPAEGSLDFHDTYLKVEEIIPPGPKPGAAPTPPDGEFSSFVAFKLSGYAGTTALTNFPVAIRLSPEKVEDFDYADCAANGADIRFTDADGNFIPHEIDTWNPNGESILWVKVPEVKPSGEETKVFMFFKDAKADTQKAEGTVWADAKFKSVWHLNFDGANTTDAVASYAATIFNPNDYCKGSSDSLLGGGYHSEQNLTVHGIKTTAVAGFAQTDGTATLSAWVRQIGGNCDSGYPDQTTYPQIKWASWGNCGVIWNTLNGGNANSTVGIELCYEGKGKQNRKFVCRTQTTTTADVNSEIETLYDKQWHYFVVRWNGTQRQVLIDGVVQNNFTAAAKLTGNPTGTIRMGARSDSSTDCSFTGDFDEMRHRAACSSDDWIAAEYANVAGTDFVVNEGVRAVSAELPVVKDFSLVPGGRSAELAALVKGVGDGATKLTAKLAYGTDAADLPTAKTVATDLVAGSAFAYTLTGLAENTTYAYALTFVNNAASPKEVVLTGTFTTGVVRPPAGELASEKLGGEGFKVTLTVTDVGEGVETADVYYTVGTDPANLPVPTLFKAGVEDGETLVSSHAQVESGVQYSFAFTISNAMDKVTTLTGNITPGIDFRRPDVNIAEYSRGVKMTVSGYTETETLTNFPVLVRLSEGKPTGFSYADFYSADGSDLCFIGADGKMLAHEIDTWNPQGESLVWVQVPELTKDFSFSMWYRSSKPGSVFTTDPMWAAFIGVWHLGEGGDSVQAVFDSAAYGLHASTHKNSLAQPAGIIGAARRVSTKTGASDGNGHILIELTDAQKTALNGEMPNFTFSAWFALRSTGNGPDWAYLCASKVDDTDPGWGVQFNANASTAPGSMRVYAAGTSTVTYSKAISMRQWYKMNMVWDGKTFRAYYDGVQAATGNLAGSLPAIMGTSGRIAFGGLTGSGYGSFNGDMDEIRLKKGTSSAAWVKAEYLNETTDLLTGGEVVAFAEKPKPIGSLAVTDYGAAFAQFAATLSSLGEGATTAELQAKVWTGEEPADWTVLATDLAVDVPVRAVMTGLSPETAYSYKLRLVCDAEGSQPSDLVEGTFTTVGTGASGVGGKVSFVGNDYVHVYDSHTKDLTFVPPAGVSSVQLLLVGGGGAGGHTHGGGGAGGSVTAVDALDVTAGLEYKIEIGEGGIASKAVGTASTAGTATSLKLDGTVVATANGGKAGGNNATCNGGDNDNFKGGVKNNNSNSGGGGAGAGQVGGSASNDSPPSGGTGGNGFVSSITGITTAYGGGGGGGTGATGQLTNPSSPGSGGLGGGGKGGGGNVATEIEAAPAAGTDGLGGGGGGGAIIATYAAGADGGSGFAAIRYTMAGSGEGSAVPRVSLDTATYEGDLKIRIGYRVGWAGQGQDKAAVKLLWGYTPTAITREVAISDATVGSDTFVFSAPLDQTTYYFKVMASNDAGSDESDWTLSVVVPKYSGEVPGDKQVPALEGDVVLAHVDGRNATLTGLAKSLGEGAAVASAVAYVGLTDDVLDMTNQVPVAIVAGEPFACYLTELDIDTTYYCYVEVKNDLGAAISSPVMSFTTLSGSKLATPTVSSTQAKVTVTGSLLTVGAGTTDVYVSWNNGAYEKLASFTAESASTAFTAKYDSQTWKSVSWKILCSNECVSVTGEPTGEYWTDLRTGTQNLTDTSVYTWKADDDGNWDGNWNDPAHWASSQAVCVGYPNGQNATATFKDCTLEHPVTVNVNGKYAMGTLTCAGTAASKIALVGTGVSASQLTCGNLPTAMQTGSSLTFKDLTLTRSYNTATWYVSQQNRATDLRIRFVNVTMTGISDFVMGSARSRLEFVGSSKVTFSGKLSFGGEDATMVIDGATLQSAHLFMPAEAAAGNQRVIFCGAAPKYTVTGSCGSYSQSETAHFVFKLPKGGWTAAPLQMTGTDAKYMFAKNYSTGASKYLVEIDPASPAVIHTDDLLTDVPLITTKKGFFTDNMGDAEGKYVTLPTRGGKKVGTYAFSDETTPLSLSLKTLQGKRAGTVVVIF